MKTPYITIFLLLILAAVIYFALKTQIETLFQRLKTGTMPATGVPPAPPPGYAPNNSAGTVTTAPANNSAALSCPIDNLDFNRILIKGMAYNREVEFLQCTLNLSGENLVVDGRYGSKTEAALARYLGINPPVPAISLTTILATKK